MQKKNEVKSGKIIKVITVVFDIGLIVASVIFIWARGVDKMDQIHVFNIGMDLVGMMLGLVILLCSYMDIQKGISDYRYFRYMLQVAFLGIFADIGGWVTDGLPELRFWNYMDNLLFYTATPTMVYFLWLYMKQLIGRSDGLIKKMDLLITVGTVVEVVLCFGNGFGGYYFWIDEAGNYVRGNLYPLFMGFIFLSAFIVLFIVIARWKWFSRREIIVIAIYVFTPLPTVVLSMLVYGISINNVMVMFDILVMYAVLNVEQGRQKLAVEKELSTAASIQKGVLPSAFPLYPDRKEFFLHASMDPAKEVGGDFYDVFMTDHDHLVLVVGDVAGKGIPAALFMLLTRTLIKGRAQMGGTPAEIIQDVNLRLFEDNKAKMFVTIWMVIINLSNGHVWEVNAGHECPAVRRGGGDYELVKTKHDLVVGGRKKTQYHDLEYDLSPGDRLFMYTDGVPEATNGEREMFGTERMLFALNANKECSPEELLKRLRKKVDDFVGDADQFDDMTMMSFVYNGPMEEEEECLNE